MTKKRKQYSREFKLEAVRLLDEMRHREDELADFPLRIYVNADYAPGKGHSAGSRHYFGDAFDISIINGKTGRPLPLMEQFIMALRYCWTGVGFYPYWTRPGVHVDRRPLTIFGRRAMWWRDKNGKYQSIGDWEDFSWSRK